MYGFKGLKIHMSYMLTTTLTGWKGGAHAALRYTKYYTCCVRQFTFVQLSKIKLNNLVKGF